ncbi:MAG: non-heme iron oxygenase ferredoxin subunit [bacterium]|nr:non-heme iron oxygenase ferredoxin subunit [Gemmatimonadota bacterium]HIL90644.1 non-heme iron oxygenase ferredoxin subunit [Gemmatimonadota bacterium]
MSSWVRAAAVVDCDVGTLKGVMVENTPIVLANVNGDIYALQDECSHEEYPLSDGELEGDDLVCIYHGARFECATGHNKSLPAIRPVKSFAVQVRDNEIYIDLS